MADINLLNKNDSAEVDKSLPKIISVAVAGIAAAGAFGYFTKALFQNASANSFVLNAAAAVLFIIIFFLQSFYVKSLKINMIIAAGEALGLSSFFLINNYSFLSIGVVTLIYISLYSALKRSRDEFQNQLKIRVIKAARVSTPKIIATLAILLAINYSQPFYPENLVISKSLIRSIVQPSEMLITFANNYFHLGLNKFSIDMTLPQLAESNGIPVEILQGEVQSFGIKMTNKETILDATYDYINNWVKDFSVPVKWAIFAAIFLLAFLTVKSFFWFFYWLIYLFIYLSHEILLALGFAHISYEQISKEIIIL